MRDEPAASLNEAHDTRIVPRGTRPRARVTVDPEGEEIASSVTHGIGFILGTVELILLVVFSSLYGDAWTIVSCSIFGATIVMMYAMSTLYHGLRGRRVKHIFKILDHSSIFFLIAGTYTPFTLVFLRGPWGWTLFGIVWAGFILGTVFKSLAVKKMNILSTATYIIMGWGAVIALKELIDKVPPGALIFLILGGLMYTIGVPFYAMKKIPFNHAVWHLFVLAGTTFHFLSVFLYVIPGHA
ncbi:MAG: PAQR family membrane homeostasis protein TrhA [Thermoplasmatota archaeon]